MPKAPATKASAKRRTAPATPERDGSKPRERRRKKRDEEVLSAAAKVFAERGYADASVQDVADELGILKGSLYHYIRTKEDLLFWLLEEAHRDVEEILEAVAAVEGLNPLERIELYVRRQVVYNLENLQRVSIYYDDLDRLSDLRRKRIVDRRAVHDRFITRLIAEAQEQGLADPTVDAKLLSNCVFATIIWTYRWYKPRGGASRETVVDVCAKYAIGGITGGPGFIPASGSEFLTK
ncbi:MAG TPA: TetR/AcrR family transcriptional regulator [Solirubrobacteraceae bacterium]|jgi:AcrR family transcriptional regulator|nr:TetR/AcrR family transcriptional regulator [Solirubrobacteraceae bacterium]